MKQVANDVEQRQITQEEYDKYLNDADNRCAKKREDKNINKPNTKVVMLDLQKCLPTLYLKNCTLSAKIVDTQTNLVVMYGTRVKLREGARNFFSSA